MLGLRPQELHGGVDLPADLLWIACARRALRYRDGRSSRPGADLPDGVSGPPHNLPVMSRTHRTPSHTSHDPTPRPTAGCRAAAPPLAAEVGVGNACGLGRRPRDRGGVALRRVAPCRRATTEDGQGLEVG